MAIRAGQGGGAATAPLSHGLYVLCVMSPVCTALAYATELSERTFSATAALIGAAMFALISDIAARSGSSSPAIALSSSRVSCLYSGCSPMWFPPPWLLGRLVDRDVLRRAGDGGGVVGQDVRRERDVHRDRQVCVDER